MHLIFSFLGFLSMGLFIRSKNYSDEKYEVSRIWLRQIRWVRVWFFLIGILLPITTLFIYELWYVAILYSLIGIFVANVISEYYTLQKHNKTNNSQPFIISILASMFLLLIQII